MTFSRRSFTLAVAAAAALGTSAQAQSIPAGKQMRIIVPYSAGGTSDILGRKLAQQLGERLGRQVIVDNKAGAGGSIGTEATVRADADGTTILLHSGAIATEPSIKSKLPYDVSKDLAAVTTVVRGPFALVVSNELPVKSVAELMAYAKANPGKVNFGTPGMGTSVHFASEYFKTMAKVPLTHVPYKGASAALTALMGNEVQMVIDPLATAKKYAEAGKIRALAVTTAQRSSLWPQMPTVAEGGVPGFDTAVWYGMYVPAKTPAPIVEMLNKEIVGILKSDDMRKWLSNEGLEPVGDTPAQSQAFLREDIERWKVLAKSAGIQPE
ncbi:MFS transporter [Alicycliphilus denitrificans]|mgnify:CR=1 FL=1|jgi:tripartite-type tricarboxylate transporter receptor subunit TctC|uniref:Bug family tripartite tricarboxylate transporter substrate binding protein n=1 Tax=Alicycliphilus denitrificans TaxID=179636 RepID=UPI000959F2AE|nr:tripartite tricarboxylate transporter substrate binding protein [Alicycliphilus denitrificans]MBN9573891.1 tripartite tricarboxylate transporter substrate binding protein [Alicycliphilus denitrificans]OJW87012.1 MAG: ABC transporter substrate-binding protein [Alicycliphilus sp. 69-12]BCN39083.1 MFS transporter [Alicycliphilus denitrificans]HRP20735.1 tripartite tricarboxylate transporter substrate binding protein [Alicycliphilus sp.]